MTRRLRGDRGSVSLFVVLMVPALLAVSGLVLDGGRQLQTRRDAAGAAAAAARAATQLSEHELYGRSLAPTLAAERARAELAAEGVSGDVAVAGNTVTVTVTEDVDYLILPGSRRVSSSSSATALQGVSTGQEVGP
jgi:Flp pilus assembly protein TadG